MTSPVATAPPRSTRRPRGVAAWGLALVLLLNSCAPDPPPEAPATPPNLVLISVDTLRADHLGSYGYARATSPFLDELAADGARFAACFAQAPNTAPSHMTVMTSLHPTAHGVSNQARPEALAHPAATPHLAELLTENGFRAAGFTDGGPTTSHFGFGRGFDIYDSTYEGVQQKVDRALGWLDRRADEEQPFFLFLHTYEVHAPYTPPPEEFARFTSAYDGLVRDYVFDTEGRLRSRDDAVFHQLWKRSQEFEAADVAFLIELYDACIAHTDAQLRRLSEELEERGLLENTLLVLMSDHGEEFGEHGAFSHKQLHREVLHVPLILSGPGIPAGRVVEGDVGLIDLAPTLLELLDIERPDHFQGRSLSAQLQPTSATLSTRPQLAELYVPEGEPIASSLQARGHKLLKRRFGRPPLSLYDLGADPGERAPLELSSANTLLPQLRAQLADWQARNRALAERHAARPLGQSEEAPEEILDELRQLGY